MAISCSAEFKARWAAKQGVKTRLRLAYKRRYMVPGASPVTYANEADWQYLYEGDFVTVGNIVEEISDNGRLVKFSAVSLVFDNTFNQWIETDVPPSFFAGDSAVPNGYIAFKTIWQVQEGIELADGTVEWIAVFTGYGQSPVISGRGAVATVLVTSYGMLLERADAEAVGEEPGLEDCIPPTGDGSRTVFESTSTGVDYAKTFLVNGAAPARGSGWRVANANEVPSAGNTGRLEITADAAPGSGQSVQTSVKRWLQNQRIETLLGLLCDEAGIGSGARTIVPVSFPGGLSGRQTVDSQAEWMAYLTAANIDFATIPGSVQRKWYLIDDFSDGDYTNNPTWTVHSAWIPSMVAVSSGRLSLQYNTVAGVPTIVSVPFSKTSGTWVWKWRSDNTPVAGQGENRYWIMSDSAASPNNGYFIGVQPDGSAALSKMTSGSVSVLATFTAFTAALNQERDFRVTRDSDGSFEVFVDGSSVASATDDSINTSVAIRVESRKSSAIDDLYWTQSVEAAETPTNADAEITLIFNLQSAPTAMGVLEHLEDLNGGAITLKTAGADDAGTSPASPGTFDALVDLDPGGIQAHTPKQWLKIYLKITPSGYDGPQVHRLISNFTTTDVFISLANHRGMKVVEAIEKYIALPDYELRFQGDGTLYIGPKTVTSAAVVTLTQENAIIDIDTVDRGIPERVVRGARVRHQGFVSIYDDTVAGVSAAVKAAGDELATDYVDVDLTGVAVANDLNIAEGHARRRYESGRRAADDPRPPIRLTVSIWDAPWAQAGDIVTLEYYDHPLLKVLAANDELFRADSPYAHAGNPANVIAKSADFKIIKKTKQPMDKTAQLVVEEIPA